MGTYVNNLRLLEITTGDESGTWGTKTNTNLELIADAFGSGTEAITTNADTHTTTIADGAADEGRAIFLKYTGTLDSACTITIAPNTVNKVWLIENATSGSQNIIISQGSGANITIGNGKIAAVLTDGAGGGAAVLDAFADLELSSTLTVAGNVDFNGALDVDGTTNLDAVDIDGAVQIDSTVTVGVDDTGYDVKFFGATASAYMLWDESADDLILGGAAGLVVPDSKLTLASTAVTSTGAELNILDGATVVVGEINYLDLGATAVGTAIASKAVVLDSNKDYTGIRNLTATTLIGALTGDASGNAATATALETARTIGGTSFDGTANIAVALAADATTLATPRAINGVDFDGSAPITVTAAAGTLSGATLASGVTASSLTSVGTLTSLTTSGDIVIDATDKIRLDGSASGNTYITESAADIVSIYTEGIQAYVFGGSANPYLRIQAANGGVGAVQYYEDDGGSGQALQFQAGVRGGDGNYYISTNATIHSDYAIMCSARDVTVGGALAKGSGSFKIDHPLPSMKDTHSLVHSFMESPRADLQYRGSVTLANGTASVDLDGSVGMTDGTWELLCRDPQVFLQNEDGWSALKGSVSGSTLIITCKDTTSFDTVSWMVVAERQDEHMMDTSWTDDDGRPILEPLKPEDVEDGS